MARALAGIFAVAVISLAEAANLPTFTKDIAPILFRDCAPCHRPGEAGPFSLLTYADARKHARDLAEMTERRLMPPWLPSEGPEVFRDARRLSDSEITLFRTWAEAGTPEGNPQDLPAAPRFIEGWQLGQPDLAVTLPVAYEFGPDGADLFRNFIVPLPLVSNRFVRAVEFRPNNPAIHHARLLLDSNGEARQLDGKEAEPGFGGTMPPGRDPLGFALAWAPGRLPAAGDDGLSWSLEPGTDLIVSLHLQRTGKPERVRPQIGFYFTDKPPTNTPVFIGLVSHVIEIPPGATNYAVERSFTLPVDADLISVLPHAHYLGRDVLFTTTAPGGTPQTRLHISQWDFNWQRDYRYLMPISLSAGTRLDFRLTFDNSTNNLKNPSRPPRLVRNGWQTTDEMAQLWLQLLPRDAVGQATLCNAFHKATARENAASYLDKLSRNPEDASSRFELARSLSDLDRMAEAFEQLKRAAEARPDHAQTQHFLGVHFLHLGQLAAARNAFGRAVQCDAQYYNSYFGLGVVATAEDRLDEAEAHFRTVLRLNPGQADPQRKLDGCDLGRMDEALEYLAQLTERWPNSARAQHFLGLYFLQIGQLAAARDTFNKALRLDAQYYDSHMGLGVVAFAEHEPDEAETHFRTVLKLNPGNADAQRKLAEIAARRRNQ